MQNDQSHSSPLPERTDVNPLEMARRDQRKALPKRFYAIAALREDNGEFAVTLDGQAALTPGRHRLAVPDRATGEALVAEWAEQVEVIDPSIMPITRMLHTALDAVSGSMEAVRNEIVKYAGSDLLCYRAGEPQSLVALQALQWDPVLAWAREDLGARFIQAEGVMFVSQPETAIAAVRRAVEAISSPLALTGLHVMTTLTGSVLLALAVNRIRLTPKAAWDAAHVDEDFQIQLWGADSEAMHRRDRRWTEMTAAAMLATIGK